MAKEQDVTEPTDEDLFNEATSDAGDPAIEISPLPESLKENLVEQPEPEAEVAAEPAKAEDDKPDPALADDRIPKWRRAEMAEAKRQAETEAQQAKEQLAAERAARTALEQRLAALEKPAQPKAEDEPDPLIDPKAYREHMEKRFEERLLNERREMSLEAAHGKYGAEFEEAYKAASEKVDPALKAKMQSSRNPGETLIQWHREQKTMREVGTDPNAWLEKKLEERLKDPAFLAKAVELARGSATPAQPSGRPNVKLPPSLSSASRSNAAVSSSVEDVSDEQLFQEITAA